MRLFGLRQGDALAASAATIVGVFALAEASGYAFGAPRNMGPGFFPVCLALLMIAMGIGIALEGRLNARNAAADTSDLPGERVNRRGLLAVSGAILGFGLLIDRAGLVPAIFAAVLIGALAETGLRIGTTLLLAAGLSVFTALVFIHGLALPIRAFVW